MALRDAKQRAKQAVERAAETGVRPGRPEVKTVPPRWELSLLHVGPHEELPRAVRRLLEVAAEKGLELREPVVCTFVNSPEEAPPEALETVVAVPVEPRDDLAPWATKSVELRRTDALKVVALPVKGPYEETFEALPKLYEFMEKKGLEPGGPHRCLYWDDRGTTPAHELRAELQVPIG